MSIVSTSLIGRFGNQLFQYCHARALAEQTGSELHTPEWIGEKIFEIPKADRSAKGDIEVTGYCQDQASLIYTRKQVKEWLRLKPYFESTLKNWVTQGGTVAHRRVGDYGSLGYVVVSMKSYVDALRKNGMEDNSIEFVQEEYPRKAGQLGEDISFLPDFYRMMTSDVLLRGNSSFSWWAATLSNAEVWSPVIEGIPGGVEERDCKFVRGNHPRFCSLDFVTDLYLKPE